MTPFTWDALLAPGLLAASITLLTAWMIGPILHKLTQDSRTQGAQIAASLGVFVVGLATGHEALGPGLVDHPPLSFGLGLGLIGAGIAWERLSDVTGADGGASAFMLALIIAAFPALMWLAASQVSQIDDGAQATEQRAEWRRRIAPWDPQALLALAWAAQRHEHLDRSRGLRQLAIKAGLPEAPAAELEAELLAIDGDCEAAREAFARALSARATAALETLDLRLEDAYRLPEHFVRECGLADTEDIPFEDLPLR